MIFRKKMFKKSRTKENRRIRIVLFFALIMSFLIFVDNSIEGIICGIAIKNAESIISDEANIAVDSLLEDIEFTYSDLILTTKSGSSVTAVQANTVLINRIKSEAIREITKRLNKQKCIKTVIQLGSLTDSAVLSNRGPDIPIYFDLFCSVNAEITSSFTGAGLNQTNHLIKLIITIKYCLMVINDKYFNKVITDFCIGETVIVGSVPTTYGTIYGLNNSKG